MSREAMKQALEALESNPYALAYSKAIIALRQALEQPADEPVAWMDPSEYRASEAFKFSQTEDHTTPLYTRPQPADERIYKRLDTEK